MFPKRKTTDSVIEDVKTIMLQKLTDDSCDAAEFNKILDQFTKLTMIEAAQHRRVSPDVLATVGANLAGILLILNHERAGVVASKALSFVQKLK